MNHVNQYNRDTRTPPNFSNSIIAPIDSIHSQNSGVLNAMNYRGNGASVEKAVENMMLKMGFEPGKGIGKRLQGDPNLVSIKGQRGTLGLGYSKPIKEPKFGLFRCVMCNKAKNDFAGVKEHLLSKSHFKSMDIKLYSQDHFFENSMYVVQN